MGAASGRATFTAPLTGDVGPNMKRDEIEFICWSFKDLSQADARTSLLSVLLDGPISFKRYGSSDENMMPLMGMPLSSLAKYYSATNQFDLDSEKDASASVSMLYNQPSNGKCLLPTTISARISSALIEDNGLEKYVTWFTRLFRAGRGAIGIARQADEKIVWRFRDGIPNLFWLTFFGPEYAEMIGKDRISTSPNCRISDLGEDGLLLKLEYGENRVNAKSQRKIIQHIGAEYFVGGRLFFKPKVPGIFRPIR